MKFAKRNLYYFIVHTCIGLIALFVALFGHLPDSYRVGVISGIAGGFTFSGILGIMASVRLVKNPKKAMEAEIAKCEERTRFIRLKANSAVYMITIFIESVGTIAAGILGFKELSITLAALLIIQLNLFIGFAYYYGKKY